MSKIRVFVGTMWSGEKEFLRSSISVQEAAKSGIALSYEVFAGMREIDAHRSLYGTWNSLKHEHDMFVQVDADTELQLDFVSMFNSLKSAESEGFTSLQYNLHDFLTDELIRGLNVYSTSVVFNVPNDEVYCDRSTANNRTKLLDAVAGLHSPDPSQRQAFHFGLHRGLKKRWSQRDRIADCYRRLGDDRRALAVLGFLASDDFKSSMKTSYADEEFEIAYVNACQSLSIEP